MLKIPANARKKVKPTMLPVTDVKRGTEIIGCHTHHARRSFEYVGTISRHGRVNKTYSFRTPRGRVVAHANDLGLVLNAVKKLHRGVMFGRICYGGR